MAASGSLSYDAEFTANTSQGQQSLRDYLAQIRAVDKEIKQATRDAKEQYQQQMLAARASGASQEELARIQQRYAQSQLAIKNTQKELTDAILTGNYAALESEEALNVVRKQATESITAQTVAIREYAAANEVAHKVSNQSAASGFVMGVEGKASRRAVEVFLGQTLGLQGAFQTLFPIVAGVQFLSIVKDAGEAVLDVGNKAVDAGKEISAAFGAMHDKTQVSIDDLTVQADKLDDNIAKLHGHPGNGLKTALDEAKLAADKLMESLRGDNKELAALLKEHSVNAFGTALSGVASTGKQAKQILTDRNSDDAAIRAAGAQYQTDLLAAGSDPNEQRRVTKNYTNSQIEVWRSRFTNYGQELQRLQGLQGQYQSQNIASQFLGLGPGDQSAKIANITGVMKYAQDQIGKLEAQQRLTTSTEQNNDAKGDKESSGQAQKDLEKRLQKWKQLQTQVREAQAESVRLSTQYSKDSTGLANDFDVANQRDQNAQLAVAARMTADFVKSLSSLSSATITANRAAAEQAITQNLAEGKITAYDAAIQRQTLHTQEYTEALQQLQSSLSNVQGDSLESNTRRNQIQQQIVELNARRSGEQLQDNAAVASQTVAGALKNANTKWLQDTQNLAPQIASVYTNVFSGINSQLTSIISGQKTSWSQFFASIAAQFANIGLNSLEAPLMNKAVSGGGFTSVLKSIPLIGGLFGGFRASGGPVEAGKTYIVGEQGPEPVTFGSSGVMGTNRDFKRMGSSSSGNNYYSISVPNGVTPEQFHQTMSQLIPQIRRQAAGDAVKAMTERDRRKPATASR